MLTTIMGIQIELLAQFVLRDKTTEKQLIK